MPGLAGGVALLCLLTQAQVDLPRTLTGKDCAPWAKVELVKDRKTRFAKETYLPATEHKSFKTFGGGVVKAFGSTRPAPNVSLLHHAPPPKALADETPVLLVHGVGSDATLTWYARNIGGEEGLVPYLVEQGRRVFAVTFPVSHGDNVGHAVHLAHALARIRKLTGQAKVDLVAHSMGGLAARAYLVRVDRRIPRYAGDVRRLVLIATPNAGLDLTFRHPYAYQVFAAYGFPSPWLIDRGRDVSARSIFGPAYRGHAQMTADLSRVHRLTRGGAEERAHKTYRGISFADSKCPGIKGAIRSGGRFLKRLNKRKLPKQVEVYLVAGDDNKLRYYDKQNRPRTQVGEYDAPSDGLVFVTSALARKVLTSKRATVKARLKVHAPHFELVYADEVKRAVAGWLKARVPTTRGQTSAPSR